jgi:hypothetical protein
LFDFHSSIKKGSRACCLNPDDYNKGSGQLVNKQKSAIFFSPNYEQECKQEVQAILQIPNEALGERYLGLPTSAGRGAPNAFNYVSARVRGFVRG